MDDIVMQALRNGWRLGAGTVVRQSPVYHRAPASRLDDAMVWLGPVRTLYSKAKRRSA